MVRCAVTACACAAAALFVWFGQGPQPCWWLAWAAPLPLLVIALRRGALESALVTLIAWTGGRLAFLTLLHELEVPLPLKVALVAGPAIAVAAFVLLVRALVLRGAIMLGAIAFPVAWVAAEYLASSGPNGSWGALGYTQLDALPVAQLASITGVWGVSFLVAFGPAAAAIALHTRHRGLVVGAGGAIVATVAYGQARLSSTPGAATLDVGLAAIEAPRDVAAQVGSGEPARLGTVLDGYADQVRALAHAGAEVVVLPEEIVGVRAPDLERATARLAAMAEGNGVTLVAGLRVVEEPHGRNVAVAFSPSGVLAGTYVKHHLVPGLEAPRLEVGRDLVVVDGPVRYGVEICKDLDFAWPTRAYADASVRLLLVPAWDFNLDGWLHSRMAVMRGIELGLPIARAAQEGQLTVSDSYGRILAQAVTGKAPAACKVRVPVGPRPTLYHQAGDWFPRLDLAVGALVLGRLAQVLAERTRRSRMLRPSAARSGRSTP